MIHLTLPAPAKLNLFLHIIGRRNDGYHQLQTLFQLLDYCDELSFTLREDNLITCNNLTSVLAQSNLVVRAAKLLQQHCNTSQGVDIKLIKHIPIGGGLGGGSSNAATTLLALNKLWQLKLSQQELCDIGLRLGADVPIFVAGRTAWAEGIGEQLTPLALPEKWYLILIPTCAISTKEIFIAPELTRNTSPITIRGFLTNTVTLKNDCELTVRQCYPEIATALDWLAQFAPSRLTGSGSCIFSSFDVKEQALMVAKCVKNPWHSLVVRGINQSPLFNYGLFE